MGDCPRCGGAMVPRTITAQFEPAGRWVLIEGVPALVCDQCGETSYPATTMLALDTLLADLPAPIRVVEVPVYRYGEPTNGNTWRPTGAPLDVATMMTSTEAARTLELEQSRVRQLARTGSLAGAVKVGRDWLVPRAAIESYRTADRKPGRKPRAEGARAS